MKTFYIVLLGGLLMATTSFAENIKLPNPALHGGKPLMDVIRERQSGRAFDTRVPDNQVLSDILFAAYGLSHDGKHTIPTSMNRQNLNVYVVLSKGVFLYRPADHDLVQVSRADVRPLFANQDYMKTVPIILVYTGSDSENSLLHAGSSYQNVGLYAASAGLNNVVRMPREKEKIAQALDLPAEEFVIVSQAVGYPPRD